MKKLMTFLVAAVLVAFTGCKNVNEKVENFGVYIPMPEKELVFDVGKDAIQIQPTRQAAPAAEVVLLDTLLNLNLAEQAKKAGYDFDRVLELLITDASMELVSPAGFAMGVFSSLKLYVEDQNKLVAQADKVEGNKVKIKIVDGDLLAKFKEDKLRIILVGENPDKRVKLKLKTNYKAKVRVFNKK